jgi:hypothetical protein
MALILSVRWNPPLYGQLQVEKEKSITMEKRAKKKKKKKEKKKKRIRTKPQANHCFADPPEKMLASTLLSLPPTSNPNSPPLIKPRLPE